jgi:very-short-patch-repair endonuclease
MRLREYARQNRRNSTTPERIVWHWLRDRRFGEWKFRRQHPIAGYIVDFYCVELKLAIELDGRGHAEFAAEIYDVDRDCELSKLGVTMIRIINEDVRKEPVFVADRILAVVERLAPSPGASRHPLPRRGRGF